MKLIINGIASHALKRLVVTHPLPERDQKSALTASNGGVHSSSYSGQYYNTDISLGLTEDANDITFVSAICSVTRNFTVVQTPITGHKGTVKESISAEDYAVNIDIDIVSDIDQYPADQVEAIVNLMNSQSVIYVNSDYLSLFGINRLAPLKIDVAEQNTSANFQSVHLEFVSDDDYEVVVTAQ